MTRGQRVEVTTCESAWLGRTGTVTTVYRTQDPAQCPEIVSVEFQQNDGTCERTFYANEVKAV